MYADKKTRNFVDFLRFIDCGPHEVVAPHENIETLRTKPFLFINVSSRISNERGFLTDIKRIHEHFLEDQRHSFRAFHKRHLNAFTGSFF